MAKPYDEETFKNFINFKLKKILGNKLILKLTNRKFCYIRKTK